MQGMGLNDGLLQQLPVQDLLGMVMRNGGGGLLGGGGGGLMWVSGSATPLPA